MCHKHLISGMERSKAYWENEKETCLETCYVYFKVCLKEHQTRIQTFGKCTFGSAVSTTAVQKNDVEVPDLNVSFVLKLDYAWTVCFIILLLIYR